MGRENGRGSKRERERERKGERALQTWGCMQQIKGLQLAGIVTAY